MRILHVDHTPVFGGAERSVLQLAAAQRARGDDAVVATGQPGPFSKALEAAGVPWIDMRLPDGYVLATATTPLLGMIARLPAFLRSARRLRSVSRAARADVVQVHTRKAQLLSSIAFLGTKTPVVWHLRDDVPPRRVARLARSGSGPGAAASGSSRVASTAARSRRSRLPGSMAGGRRWSGTSVRLRNGKGSI